MNVKSKFSAAALSVLLVLAAVPAFAHNLVIEPDKFTVPPGETVGLYWTFTEVIGEPQYSRWATETYVFSGFMETPVEVRYKSGAGSPLDGFRPYNWGAQSIVEGPESDSDYLEFAVAETGTVVVEGRFRGRDNGLGEITPPGEVVTTRSYMKTFLNLTNDGAATRRTGGDEFLEIVFAEDVAKGGPRVGDRVKFQVLLEGEPLRNEKVFAAYSGAPSYPVEEGGREVLVNECMITLTDGDGMAEFMFDREAGWFVGAFAYPEDYLEYGGGVMFYVSSRSGGGSGGSGCDAGGGAFALPVLLALAAAGKAGKRKAAR